MCGVCVGVVVGDAGLKLMVLLLLLLIYFIPVFYPFNCDSDLYINCVFFNNPVFKKDIILLTLQLIVSSICKHQSIFVIIKLDF